MEVAWPTMAVPRSTTVTESPFVTSEATVGAWSSSWRTSGRATVRSARKRKRSASVVYDVPSSKTTSPWNVEPMPNTAGRQGSGAPPGCWRTWWIHRPALPATR